jgi:uncharacterized protein
MPKTLILRLPTVLLALASVTQALGAPSTLPQRTGVVNDYAHVMEATTVSRITALSNELYAKANARVTVLTINSLNGDDIRPYSNQVFHAWGIGAKGSDRGVLIVLAVEGHKYRVEVGYGLEAILPDGKVGSFGRDAVPLFMQKQYSAALEQMFNSIASVIADDRKVSLSAPSRPAQPIATAPAAVAAKTPAATVIFVIMFLAVPLIMFSVFVFFIYKLFTNKTLLNFGMNLNSRGGSTASSSGSDFSNSSSSDSGSSDSDGFSGGDSGGGGADGSF